MSYPGIKRYLVASIFCLPLSKGICASTSPLFESCWHNLKSKRVMQWASAYPETLSHMPSDFTHKGNVRSLGKALKKLGEELADFDDIYHASLSIASKSCPHKRHAIGTNLRAKYVAATRLHSELDYVYRLLTQVNRYGKNSNQLKSSLEKAAALKQKLEH